MVNDIASFVACCDQVSNQTPTTFPPTLIFNGADAFPVAVHRGVIDAIGCAVLPLGNPSAEGMLQRPTSFLLLAPTIMSGMK